VKSSWEMQPLGSICENLDSKRVPITKSKRVAGEIPYYGASGVVDWVQDYLFDEDLLLVSEDGANLLARTYPIAFSVSGRTWVNNHAHALRFKESITQKFVELYLNSISIEDHVSGMAQPKLNQSKLSELPIPFPPLEEQKRIVAVLDEAFAALDRARTHAETNLKNARELFASVTRQAMRSASGTDKEVTLSDVCSINSKLVDPKLAEFIDLPHLGAGNMITGSDRLIDIQTAREEKLKSGKHLFDQNAVLYSKIRPYLRKVVRPDFSGLCSADVYPLTPSGNLNRDFLFHLLLGEEFTDYAISGSERAGMPKVNRNHLFAYKFNLPDLGDQQRIVELIDGAMAQTEELQSAYQHKLRELGNLRQSLLQKAFAGELT